MILRTEFIIAKPFEYKYCENWKTGMPILEFLFLFIFFLLQWAFLGNRFVAQNIMINILPTQIDLLQNGHGHCPLD